MEECKKMIKDYVEDLKENLNDTIENALEIMKIVDANDDSDTRGYIIVLATGGPHIEINTRDGTIGCWWGSDSYEYFLGRDLINEIEEALDDIF